LVQRKELRYKLKVLTENLFNEIIVKNIQFFKKDTSRYMKHLELQKDMTIKELLHIIL
jgi:hypothetical protein